LSAEIVINERGNIEMSEHDYRTLIKLAREAEIRREDARRMSFYIGGNAGTYGLGVNAGVVF